jgi:PAS domain S-box-containing protein
VSQRVENLEELRRYATVVSDSNDAVILHDLEGTILAWNRGAQETYGYTEAEALGINVRELVAEPDREAALSLIQRVSHGEIVRSFELRRIAKDGRILDVWLTTTLLRHDDGKPAAIATTERDITERKRTVESIRRFTVELERRVSERTAQLDAANKELEVFVYSVSHDLRAPLRAIDGFSRITLEDSQGRLDQAVVENLERIRAAAAHMDELIGALQTLSHVDHREMGRQTVDVSAAARRICSGLAHSDPDRNVAVTIADGLSVEGDVGLVEVILENLIGNAWKFTSKEPQAQIEVGTLSHRGEPVIFVRDNGAGFDPTYVDKLFSPFGRLHTTSESPGTGIGLATVKRAVARHSGHCWLDGAIGRGATAYFTLPADRRRARD